MEKADRKAKLVCHLPNLLKMLLKTRADNFTIPGENPGCLFENSRKETSSSTTPNLVQNPYLLHRVWIIVVVLQEVEHTLACKDFDEKFDNTVMHQPRSSKAMHWCPW